MWLTRIFWKVVPILLAPAGLLGLVALYFYFQRPYAALGGLLCLFFYGCIFCVITGSLFLAFKRFKPKRETQFKILVPVLSVFLVLVLAELYLRAEKINRAYIEQRGGVYRSSYIKYDRNVDWHYQPGSDFNLTSAEYNYPRHHNNMGFSDVDFFKKSDSDKILIQTYGDSFTEGDGAPADSSYPAILRDLLKRNGQTQITVQNFGVCGNDPAFCWRQLKDIGAGLKPDVVIISYSAGDLTTDFFTRGGEERFKGDYYKGIAAPGWEWLYGISYVARLIANSVFGIEYKNFFLTEGQSKERIEELKPKWNHTFADIAETARQNNIKILLIKKPEHNETDLNRYDLDFTFFDRLRDSITSLKQYDLLPYYRDSAHITKNNSNNYWWPQDGHNKSTGYAVMARGVYTGLKQTYPEIFTNLDTAKTR